MDLRPESIAAYNPEVALYLLEGVPLVPVFLPLTLTFDDTTGLTTGKTATGTLPFPVATVTWLHTVRYTVERPNADVGSVLKGQNDYFTSLTPYVDVQLSVPNAPITYLPTPQFIALATLADDCVNWTLRRIASVIISGKLTRDLQDNENPYRIKMTLQGVQVNPQTELEETVGSLSLRDQMAACCCGGVKAWEQQRAR